MLVARALRRPLLVLLLAGAAALGLVVRLFVLQQAEWLIDGDEAVVGVMGQDILRGERPVFFYGQPYLGALEAYVTAAVFAAFGPSMVALKAVPLAFSVAHVVLVALLAYRWLGLAAAGLAGALAALPPLYLNVNASRALGGYPETLVLGELLMLGALAAPLGSPRRWLVFFGMGLAAGLGVWTHLLVVHYLFAVGLFVLLREPLLPLRLAFWSGVAGAMVGSAPLWWYNLQHDWATWRYFFSGPGVEERATLLEVLNFWVQSPLSLALGVTAHWGAQVPTAVAALVGALTVAALLWLAERALRDLRKPNARRHLSPAVLFVLFAVSLPVFYVYSEYGVWALKTPDTDFTGRYLLPVATLLPVAFAGLATAVARVSALVAGAAVVFLLAAAAATYVGADYRLVFQSPYYCCWAPLPSDHRALIGLLKERGAEMVIANHWVGNRLIFESHRTLPAYDYFDVKESGGADRFPEYGALLEQEPLPKLAYVLVRQQPDQERLPMDDALDALRVFYERLPMDPYVVYLPERNVHPQELGWAIAYPY